MIDRGRIDIITPLCPDYEHYYFGMGMYKYTFNKLNSGVGLIGKRILKIISNFHNLLKEFKFIFIVSDDVEISSNVEMLWGIFTRFDPSIDMYFKEVAVEKSSVTFKGQVVIDATFKDWYPNVIDLSLIHI